jgi:PAS domain S-box-containing protein
MSTNPMALHDRQRVLLEPNGALLKLLGGLRDQVVGRKIDAFLPPEERPQSVSDWGQLWDAGRYMGERHIVRLNGARLWVQYAGRICEVEGKRLALVVVLRVRLDDQLVRPRANGHLTNREREVLQLVALGYTSSRIAKRLMIANDTVRTHIRNAMVKTGARTRAQLVAMALADRHLQH